MAILCYFWGKCCQHRVEGRSWLTATPPGTQTTERKGPTRQRSCVASVLRWLGPRVNHLHATVWRHHHITCADVLLHVLAGFATSPADLARAESVISDKQSLKGRPAANPRRERGPQSLRHLPTWLEPGCGAQGLLSGCLACLQRETAPRPSKLYGCTLGRF